MKRYAILLIILVVFSQARAATYYVDSNAAAGGDGTRSSPFDTLADVRAVVDHNDVIRLREGSVFREDFDASDIDGLTIEAYGTGLLAMPQIRHDRVIAKDSWSKTSGRTNVYQITAVQTCAEGYLGLFEDDVKLGWKSSLADVDSTAGTFSSTDPDATGPGSYTLYIHPYSSTDPRTNSNVYTVTDYTRNGLFIVGDSSQIRNLVFGWTHHFSGPLRAHHTAIHGCTFIANTNHAAVIESGGIYDSTMLLSASDLRAPSCWFAFFSTDPNGRTASVERCAINSPFEPSRIGFFGHTGTGSGSYKSYNIRDCVVSGCWAAAPVDCNFVRYTRVCATSGSLGISATALSHYVDCCASSGTVFGTTASYAGAGAIVRGLRSVMPSTATGQRFVMSLAGTASVNIDKSVFIQEDTGTWYCANWLSAGATTVNTTYRATRCIYQCLGGTNSNHYIFLSDATAANLDVNDCDFNVFYHNRGETYNKFKIAGTTYNGLVAYQTAFPSLQQNSITANPEFVDHANGDFRPQNADVINLGAGLERPNIQYASLPIADEIMTFNWPNRKFLFKK